MKRKEYEFLLKAVLIEKKEEELKYINQILQGQ